MRERADFSAVRRVVDLLVLALMFGCADGFDVPAAGPRQGASGGGAATAPVATEAEVPPLPMGAKQGATPTRMWRGGRAESALPLKRRPVEPARDFREPDRGGGEAPFIDCEARCGDDDACRTLCLSGETPGEAAGFADCLECGRETGFLPRPELRVEARHAEWVLLGWDEVPGAARYTVHGLRFTPEGHPGASFESVTSETHALVTLVPGYVHSVYVVAWDETGKRRSAPSNPVRLDP